MINEVWKDIEGYERLYQVSNLGKVRSVDRIDSLGRLKPGVILKPKIEPNGYLRLGLTKNGVKKMFSVHRLVAQAFIPNPDNLPQINHKNEDKTNNVVFLNDDGSVDEFRSNLEWCTARYNTNYGTRNERAGKNMVQTMISKGIFDPEMCGLDRNERSRLYYQKNLEKMREYQREYYHRKKKKNNKPSEESLW